jgi:hypothetical protein
MPDKNHLGTYLVFILFQTHQAALLALWFCKPKRAFHLGFHPANFLDAMLQSQPGQAGAPSKQVGAPRSPGGARSSAVRCVCPRPPAALCSRLAIFAEKRFSVTLELFLFLGKWHLAKQNRNNSRVSETCDLREKEVLLDKACRIRYVSLYQRGPGGSSEPTPGPPYLFLPAPHKECRCRFMSGS